MTLTSSLPGDDAPYRHLTEHLQRFVDQNNPTSDPPCLEDIQVQLRGAEGGGGRR